MRRIEAQLIEARRRRKELAGVDRKFGRLPPHQWSKRDLRAEQQDLVAAYLARGGTITKGAASARETSWPIPSSIRSTDEAAE